MVSWEFQPLMRLSGSMCTAVSWCALSGVGPSSPVLSKTIVPLFRLELHSRTGRLAVAVTIRTVPAVSRTDGLGDTLTPRPAALIGFPQQ